MAELEDMEARVRAALEGSTDGCARCKTCDAQVNAVMAVIEDEAVNRMAEQFVAESRIRALEVRDGKVCLDAYPAREIVAMWIGSARTMIGDAENYIEMDVQLADTGEGYTFHLSRKGKLTPREARKRAEEERDKALAEVERLRASDAVEWGVRFAPGPAGHERRHFAEVPTPDEEGARLAVVNMQDDNPHWDARVIWRTAGRPAGPWNEEVDGGPCSPPAH